MFRKCVFENYVRTTQVILFVLKFYILCTTVQELFISSLMIEFRGRVWSAKTGVTSTFFVIVWLRFDSRTRKHNYEFALSVLIPRGLS